MNDEERGMLEALARSLGLTPSDWVRMKVKTSFDELTPAQKRAKNEWKK